MAEVSSSVLYGELTAHAAIVSWTALSLRIE